MYVYGLGLCSGIKKNIQHIVIPSKFCKFAPAMRKSVLTKVKTLLYTAIVAGIIWSCQEEKPEIVFPGPVKPQKEFKYLETITPDTLNFNEGDYAKVSLKVLPTDFIGRDSVSIQVCDTAMSPYKFAEIKSLKLRDAAEGVWDIDIHVKYGMKKGDVIKIKVASPDTVMYSDNIVLNMILKSNSDFYGLYVASDSVSAFTSSNLTATVRLRTAPWDLMIDTTRTDFLTITDEAGNPIDSLFSMGDRVFQPEDSCWAIPVNILEKKMDSAYVAFRFKDKDIELSSPRVLIKKVAFRMKAVYADNNQKMDYSMGTSTYSLCLPTTTDFTARKFKFDHTGDKVTIGDSLLLNNAYNTLDVSNPVTVSVWKYDLHTDYIIQLSNTGLPVVRIDTKGQSVTRRDEWVSGITMRIELPDGTVDYEGSLSLKGRGNGTWTETSKKPYALKLDEKAKILGMDKSKRWCLLANYKDRTLLRNDAAFWLSRHTNMPYTVKGRYVELVWNGKHMGNYYLCQQIRIESGRVEIADPDLNDPANGGMLVVIDDFLGYSSSDRYDKSPMVGFRSTGSNNRYKLPYVLKDPEEDVNGNLLTSSSATYQYLFNYVKNMEDAIYGLKSNPNSNWQQYLDIDRAIDFVLIQEMTMNHDSYNTWPNAGPKSTYLYKDAGGKLCYGPVWDFDYHTFTLYNDAAYGSAGSGENARIQQWEILKMDSKGNNKYYFADLVKYDSEFKARLLERWNEYKYVWKDSLPIYIDMMADSIRVSESYNDQIWAENKNLTNYKQNGDYNLSFQEAVNAMKSAFLKRWEFMDQNLKNLPN